MKQYLSLRKALGCYGTGVAIITSQPTKEFPESQGITVNSFISVSLEPPLVLWAIDRSARRYDCFMKTRAYGVSILSVEQKYIAERFTVNSNASCIEEKHWKHTKTGIPVLKKSLAYFDCHLENKVNAGDHSILIGRILEYFHRDQEEGALAYFKSEYNYLKS